MARKQFVELIDDIDGSNADQTVTFSLDGVSYEIDLSEENAARLREEVGSWVSKARRVSGRRTRGTGAAAPAKDSAKVREWARGNGYEVADRGRISAEIRNAYDAAH